MSSNWEKIQKTVKGGLHDAAETSNKYLKIGKVKLDVMSIQNSLNGTFRELGIEVFSQINEDIKGDIRQNPKVKSLIAKVNELKQSIKEDELKIDGIKK
jgi:ubiquinone biosynthesis protein UbiJ